VSDSDKNTKCPGPPESAGFKAYLALLLVLGFFSGIFACFDNWLSAFDFNVLLGQFGLIGDSKLSFIGQGGTGARHGFIFALSLIPSVMLALGVVGLAEHFGAIRAARKLLTPLMRPLLGLPGEAGLTLISSLQSSDSGGAMTRDLYDSGCINDRERSIMGAFQFSAGSSITVYLTAASAFIPALEVSYLAPLAVILFYKVVGTNLMRLYLKLAEAKDKRAGGGRVR
jgi:Uncharacterized protein conserved in bacteria